MGQKAIIKAEKISKHFDSVIALNSIDFELLDGEIHGLVGHNGSGKTTFLKILAGVLKPNSGVIEIEGKRYDKWNVQLAKKHGITMISQEFILFPNLSVLENLYLINYHFMKNNNLFSIPKFNEIESLASNYLKELDLNLDLKEKVKNLSSANKELVQIIAGLIINAKVLLLDEPTSPLSFKESQHLLEVVKSLREQKGISSIFVSHRLEEVLDLCDRITVLKEGHKVGVVNSKETSYDEIIHLMLGEIAKMQYVRQTRSSNYKSSGRTILKVENLTTLPRSPTETQLKNISFEVMEREVLGITGLLGAGKTELGKALIGDAHIIQGKIYFDDKELKLSGPHDALKKGILYITEDRKTYGLIYTQTVRFNSTLSSLKNYLNFLFINKKKETSDILKLIEKVNLIPKDPDLLVTKLSGGNQQKILFLRSLLANLKLLIIDEPTVGVDIHAKIEIRKLISQLPEQGYTVILLSGELEDITSCSDRVLIMKDGKIVLETTPDYTKIAQYL